MKIKIFLAPTLIVLIIVGIIWYVYPAYTNGFDGVKERSEKLKGQKELMASLDQRIGNVNRLVGDLSANYFDDAVVFSYIPEKKEEEKIIENLNSLATENSLSILNISVSEEKEVAVVVPEVIETGFNTLPGLAPGDAANQAPMSPKAVPRKIKVDFSVIGDYGNMKLLFDKIQKLKMFNRFSNLEIKTLLKEDQTVSESLQANMVLEFNYLKTLKKLTEGDINNTVFSSGVFDRGVISKIRFSRSIEVKPVVPGENGGSNPFVRAK